LSLVAPDAFVAVCDGNARHIGQATPLFDGCCDLRQYSFSIVEHDGIDWAREEWLGVRSRRVPADDDRRVRRKPANVTCESENLVGLEGVHPGDADETWTRAPQLTLDRRTESKIGNRDLVTAAFERSRDVLHAEGLDAEEGTKSEPFVSGNRTQQQDVHGPGRKRNIGNPQ
jgi:hypothetical protein